MTGFSRFLFIEIFCIVSTDTLHPIPYLRGGTMERGKVKFFNVSKGFGFITTESAGEEVFFHKSNVKNAGFRDNLIEGDLVEFEIKEELKGKRAYNISRRQ